MDVSSEMIHGLLPFFLVSVLKTSALTFGVIEGVAEASTAITKLFSGVVSDWWGKRKPLLLVSARTSHISARNHGNGGLRCSAHRSHRQGHPWCAP
jgi:Na+/melibiose symporter-like transporter